jgi:hypothetical protein
MAKLRVLLSIEDNHQNDREDNFDKIERNNEVNEVQEQCHLLKTAEFFESSFPTIYIKSR